MTIEQTWNNGGYLSGLKGVTIPNNTPSFNEDPRKGRHWSSDNAIQADDESLKGIFASLNSMPTVSQQDVQIPDPQPVSQSQPSEQSVAQQQTTQAIQQSQEAHVFQQQATVNQSVPAACSLMRTLTRPSKIPHMRSMVRSSRSTAIHRPSYRVPHHSLSDRPTSPKPQRSRCLRPSLTFRRTQLSKGRSHSNSRCVSPSRRPGHSRIS